MKRRRKTKELEQINLMVLAPVRLAPWTEVDGKVVIERPKPTGPGRIHEKMRYWLAVRKIRLELLLGAGDGVALVVEQLLDAADDAQVLAAVDTLA